MYAFCEVLTPSCDDGGHPYCFAKYGWIVMKIGYKCKCPHVVMDPVIYVA